MLLIKAHLFYDTAWWQSNIDTGILIDGYDCETAGEHLGEGCREWFGSAPGLGLFVYAE